MEQKNRFLIEEQDDDLETRYLTFWTDRRLFGLPIGQVVQIVGLQAITELPEHPAYVKGIISLRGQIIPVIDMRLRFSLPEAPYNDRTCIIITHVGGNDFGLIVDEVDEVTDIPPTQIAPPPKLNGEKENDYLTGIAQLKADHTQRERVALLLQTARILGDEVLTDLALATQD